jgi:hypothetical protein
MKLTNSINMPENFEGMNADELRAFIQNLEVPEAKAESVPNDEITRLKNALSKSNSEAADYRKKWQSTLSEQERLEAERQQRETDMQTQLNALLREKQTSEFEKNFLATGYSPELAKSSATAMVDGNNAQVFADMNAFIAEKTKQLQAEALNNQPQLTNGNPVVTPSPEDAFTSAVKAGIGL